MTGTENKVKYNNKNVHVAKQTEKTTEGTTTYTYDDPKSIPGAVSISLHAQGENSKFYAGGMAYYVTSTNNGYEGEQEMALLPSWFREEILNEEQDKNGDLTENFVMNGVDGVGALGVDISQRLAAVVGKFLFHGEGRGDLIALIHGLVGNEAVHLRPQGDDLQQDGDHHLKEIVFVVRVGGVFFVQIGQHVGQVDPLADERRIVTSVGIHQGHDQMHGVDVSELCAVFPVSEFFCHKYTLLLKSLGQKTFSCSRDILCGFAP